MVFKFCSHPEKEPESSRWFIHYSCRSWDSIESFVCWSTVESSQERAHFCGHRLDRWVRVSQPYLVFQKNGTTCWGTSYSDLHTNLQVSLIFFLFLNILAWPKSLFRFFSLYLIEKSQRNFLANSIYTLFWHRAPVASDEQPTVWFAAQRFFMLRLGAILTV